MPEGHVVHADARRFATALAGRVVRASSPQGRFASGAAELDGRVLDAADAYGKNLLLRFAGGRFLHVHLGLIGTWTWWDDARVQTAGRPTRTTSDAAVRLRLSASGVSAELRGAMTCALLDEQAADAVVASLGPDPIRDDADPDAALRRIRRSRAAIGTLLLDQSVVAGAGLIWRCEAPFLARISPHRQGRDVGDGEWSALWRALRRTMRAAADGRPEPYYLFRRGGQPCLLCATPVEKAAMSGRPVWWCPRHQPG